MAGHDPGTVGHDAGIADHARGPVPYATALVLRKFIHPQRVACRLFWPEKAVPAARINMRKIKDVLRLKFEAKLSHERIADALGISKGVVAKYASLAAAAGLNWATVQSLTDRRIALQCRALRRRSRIIRFCAVSMMDTPIRPTPALTLHSVKLRLLSVPMRRPIVSNPTVGRYAEWPFILIDLHTNEGIVGHSYLEPYVAASASYIFPAIEAIAANLKSRALTPIDCFATAMKTVHLSGKEGVGLVAASGLDMAIWDAVAKAAGLPLAEYLGASRGAVRAYNTNGLWLLPADQLRDEAISLVEEGNFSAIKMRMGREKFSADVEALQAVRSAVGQDVRIMVDFNQGLDMGEALLRLHALDSEGLQWFEEPIAFDNFAGCARLARELKTPIQIGEDIYGPRSFHKAVQEGAADLYMPDMMRIGGITGFLRCAAIAGAAGIPLSSHLYPEASAHVLRVAETAHWLEWRDWAHPFLAEPFEVQTGHLVIPDRPGLGISWNESAVSKLVV